MGGGGKLGVLGGESPPPQKWETGGGGGGTVGVFWGGSSPPPSRLNPDYMVSAQKANLSECKGQKTSERMPFSARVYLTYI